MSGKALMRHVAEAFAQGDLRPLFSAINESIVWKAGFTTRDASRFGGTYTNREGVVEVTSELAAAYVFRRFQPIEIVCCGEVVWGVFDVEGDYRPPGAQAAPPASFNIALAIRWRVRNNKVVEHQSFFDTDALVRRRAHDFPL